MPPRRSSRAPSAKPPSTDVKVTSKPASKVKSKALAPKTDVPKPKVPTSKKRAASPEHPSSPVAKRIKGEEQNVAPSAEDKPKSKTGGRGAPKKATTKLPAITEDAPPLVQRKPYINSLPTPPEKARPGLQLFVWGAGNFGQFGLGPDVLDEISKPRKSVWAEKQMQEGTFGEVGAGIECVAGGGMHTLFIDEKGTVWSCGLNDSAALGRVTEDVPDPDKPGSFLDIDELTSIPHPIQSLVDENFRAVQVVAGDSICAAVSDQGDLRVWGSFRANEGSLGFSDGQKNQFIPVPILNLSKKPGDVEKVSSVVNGANHLLVLTTHGNIYTWGAGEQGQLGRKVIERRKIHGTVPEKVTLSTRSRKAVRVGAGIYHSFAVDDHGDVWGWGLNTMGQTGTGHDSAGDDIVQQPKKVLNLSKEELNGDEIVEIAGGEHHTLFLTAKGRVYACGRANAGQLGLSDNDAAFVDSEQKDWISEPVVVSFPEDDDPVVHIAAGLHNNMAITKGGALYSWGQGTQSELGVPDVEVRTPRVIVRREGGAWEAVKVSCGGQHTLGLFRSKK